MNRRQFLKTAAATFAAGSTSGYGMESTGIFKASQRPNIILVMADDLGYECMGANGGTSYATPVFDRLAAKGVRFEHCYAQPLCTPTRVKLMTGISNIHNYTEFGVLDRQQTTFAHLFKDAGYATCVVGKWQLGREPDSPKHFGFDRSCLWQHTRRNVDAEGHDTRFQSPALEVDGIPKNYPGKYGPDVVSDFACDFMEKHKDKPFLVYYPMILTHCPFSPTPDSKEYDPTDKGSLKYKGKVKYFGDMVTYMDKILGKITEKVEQLSLAENTLIIFLGDNGTDSPVVSKMGSKAVPGKKGDESDNGTRVPMLAYWPGKNPKGRLCTDIIDVSDFLPTICQAANISIPEHLNIDGRTFLPQVLGQKGNPRKWIYMWYNRSGGATAKFEFARNQQYKLVRNGDFSDMTDGYEPKKLDIDSLTSKQASAYKMLSKVLEKYKNARPGEK